MRRPVTDIALLSFIARKKADAIRYNEATKACKSSSSASRALHQLIREGLIEPRPKLLGLRYVTEYMITPKGKQASLLALQLSELREVASRSFLGKEEESKQVEAVKQSSSRTARKNQAKQVRKTEPRKENLSN